MPVNLPITCSVWGSIHRAYQKNQPEAVVPWGGQRSSWFESKASRPLVVVIAILSALATPIFILLDAIYLAATCSCCLKNRQVTIVEPSEKTSLSFSTRAVAFDKKAFLEHQKPKVGTLALPKPTLSLAQATSILNRLEGKFGSVMDEEAKSLLAAHKLYCKEENLSKYASAVEHIRFVSQDLETGNYPPRMQLLVLQSLLKMTLPIDCPDAEVQFLSQLTYTQEQREWMKTSKSVSGGIPIIRQNGKIVARLRDAATGWPQNLKVSLASYEVDRAMGVKSVVTTIRRMENVLAQTWIQNGTTLYDVLALDPQGAKKLQNLDGPETQLHLLSALLRNNGDGHGNNIMVYPDKEGNNHLVDVDQEQDFRSINLDLHRLSSADEGSGPRLAAMALPQTSKPIPKVILKLLSWEGLKGKTVEVLRKNQLDSAIASFEERWDKLQEIFRLESTLKEPRVTVRDVYFAFHGKDYYFEECIKSGVRSYDFFSTLAEACDDKFPQSFSMDKVDEKERLLYKNAQELDPCTPPKFSMKSSEKKEQYAGNKVVEQTLEKVSKERVFKFVKVEKGALDEEGWNKYLEHCEKRGEAPKPYMLAHFLQGFAKRMTRQIAHKLPFCNLKPVQEKGQFYIEIESPFYLRDFFRLVKEDPKGTYGIVEIDPAECDYENMKKALGSKDFGLYNFLSGKTRKFLDYIAPGGWGMTKNLEVLEKEGRYYLVYNGSKS